MEGKSGQQLQCYVQNKQCLNKQIPLIVRKLQLTASECAAIQCMQKESEKAYQMMGAIGSLCMQEV